jgi:hypothetical protein
MSMLNYDEIRDRNLDRAVNLAVHGRIRPEEVAATADAFNRYSKIPQDEGR